MKEFLQKQIESWQTPRKNFADLANAERRTVKVDGVEMILQFNPARIVSTGAKIDKAAIAARPCFLCKKNRPQEQDILPFDDVFDILVNPFPILPEHFTIAAREHQPQHILPNYNVIFRLLDNHPEVMVFYNGPKCGASAPDHLHFQAGTSMMLPLQKQFKEFMDAGEELYQIDKDNLIVCLHGYVAPVIAIISNNEENDTTLFRRVYEALPWQDDDTEPMMNIIAWRNGEKHISAVLPRRKHRPNCYFSEEGQRLISPGAIDMGGMLITPRLNDFEEISAQEIISIFNEVSLEEKDMDDVVSKIRKSVGDVTVGIVSGKKISFSLNGNFLLNGQHVTGKHSVTTNPQGMTFDDTCYPTLSFIPASTNATFTLEDVTIGVNFHWQRQECQTFEGTLSFIKDKEDNIVAINTLSVENYLKSVISSEMSATSSLELLKAHAVISRSWLLAQIVMRKTKQNISIAQDDGCHCKEDIPEKNTGNNEIIRWYDRDDHMLFDVCADDHCQRYQGVTKQTSPLVAEAVRATTGEVLMYEGEICDARFSKCCGGASEEFSYCWENIRKPYLRAVCDNAGMKEAYGLNLTDNTTAETWIRTSPEAFCNTSDKDVLRQVLNDFDQETPDFYRWEVRLSQEKIQSLLKEKVNICLGRIKDIIAVERGYSGRISRLRIVGENGEVTIGKELEIRRALSDSHLYSSAFTVDIEKGDNDYPSSFILKGAGWGHGVGLCQIGAAVMGQQGYDYKSILQHYYRNAEIKSAIVAL